MVVFSEDVVYEEQPFHGVKIKAASKSVLIEICLDHFGEGSTESGDPFVDVFFLTYHWFMKSEELLQHLIDLFDNSQSEDDNHLHCKIIKAVRYWLGRHGADFERNEEAMNLLDVFNSKILEAEHSSCSSQLNLDDWYERTVSNKTNYVKSKSIENKSLDFNHVNGETIADLLLFLCWKNIIQIPIWEWRDYGKSANTAKTPFLKDQIVLFNDVSKYCMGMCLNNTCAEKRADSVHKFVVACKRLLELNDFNTLLAVIGGLGHSAMSRLRKTREYLSMEDKLFIKETHETLTSDNNYTKYRSQTENIDGFIVPILGVVMKDLVILETAVKDHIDYNGKKLINFHKLVQVSKILEHILRGSTIHPDVAPREDLLSILRVSLKSRYTEDALYDLSLEREPRKDSLHSTSSLSSRGSLSDSNTAEFADWVTGIADIVPDREVVETHVREMVNTVFETYDLDRNNYINKDEFDSLATNFSFIDSFAVLDVNGDSNISREEMINYFMNANSQEMTKEFLHEFVEASYFSPHNCVYCTGFLWGVGKVGFKCKVCQISTHKECKNRVVLECRPNRSTLSRSEKSRKGIMKRIKSLDKDFKGSFDGSSHNISNSRDSLLSTPPPSPLTNGDVFTSTVDIADPATIAKLKETVSKLLSENENLQKENKELKTNRQISESRIQVLQHQLNSVREQSVFFMVEQVERLNLCKETDV